MTRTTRLVYEDAGSLEFEAVVLGAAGRADELELDRTAFYAEGGGQPADRGRLAWADASTQVVDVQLDEAGRVFHRVEGPLPPPGTRVHGFVDRPRRLELTALHTAQHMLSRALELEAGATTVSARLGSVATIDVARVDIPEAQLERAETLANSIVDDDVEVKVWYPTAIELEELALRKKPKVVDRVRVVAIGAFDVTPCGGTHCSRSSAVGLVAIRSVERYKGLTRVSFTAGTRGRREVLSAHRQLATLTRLAGGDLEGTLARARTALEEARRERAGLRGQLAARLAAEWLPVLERSPTPVASFVLDDLDTELLRDVVSRLAKAASERTIVGVGGDRDGRPVVVRGPGSPPANDVLRALTARLGGRGGGKNEAAEGRLAPGADVSAIGAIVGPVGR